MGQCSDATVRGGGGGTEVLKIARSGSAPIPRASAGRTCVESFRRKHFANRGEAGWPEHPGSAPVKDLGKEQTALNISLPHPSNVNMLFMSQTPKACSKDTRGKVVSQIAAH